MSRSDDHHLNGADVKGADGALTTYSWDIENRMVGVALPTGILNTMMYYGDGIRSSYADSVILRNFLWDEANIARQTDVNNATNRNYTLNPQGYGELISQDGPAFHHYDALGSTRTLTDSGQNVTDTRDYRAFGATNASSGSTVNRFWWVGKLGYYLQPDTQDCWVRARILMPRPGRWEQRDVLCGLVSAVGANCYRYANNRVLAELDPSGLVPEIDFGPCSPNNPKWIITDAVRPYHRVGGAVGTRHYNMDSLMRQMPELRQTCTCFLRAAARFVEQDFSRGQADRILSCWTVISSWKNWPTWWLQNVVGGVILYARGNAISKKCVDEYSLDYTWKLESGYFVNALFWLDAEKNLSFDWQKGHFAGTCGGGGGAG